MFLNTSMLSETKTKSHNDNNSEIPIPEADGPLSKAALDQPNILQTISPLDVMTFRLPSSHLLDFSSVEGSLPVRQVIGSPVTALPFDAQMQAIVGWAEQRLSKMICVANAHMLVEAHWHPDFAEVLQKADLVTSDGMPLVWMMKLLGVRNQERVAGVDILIELCRVSTQRNLKVYFLGGQQSILDRIKTRLDIDFPSLAIAGMEPLPFRPITAQEDNEVLERIQASGANLVFVSLGCPKQEKWMAQNRNRVPAVMIGLGGAFPVYGGIQRRAPRWVREAGLEWAYRLIQEPRRLAKRYSQTNQVFLWLSLKQLVQAGVQNLLRG
jgi:N-acetylglucosaminyldiphosphoundecaprenol N-acetyl-beta-D-mannosaminyltransferase